MHLQLQLVFAILETNIGLIVQQSSKAIVIMDGERKKKGGSTIDPRANKTREVRNIFTKEAINQNYR